MTEQATLTIGQVAGRAGVNASAIRYYERNGLLPEPERVSGQRRYSADTLRRLQVIDIAKQAGFTLEEIRILLDADDSDRASQRLVELASQKLPAVDELIARATAMRQWLTLAQGCECSSLDLCDLFTAGRAGRPRG